MGYLGSVPGHHQGSASVALDRGPGVIYGIVVSATNTRTVLLVYDGEDTAGDLLLRVAVPLRDTIPVNFPWPLPYQKGLYVAVDSGIGGFTILFDHRE